MNATARLRAPELTGDPEASIREFISEEAAPLAASTAERYEVVLETLFEFLDAVDVAPRFGPEIAAHLAAERQRLGDGAFLPTLGFVSLVRVLPEFLDDPWLPPAGAQRRAHRAVVDRLLVFLRRRALIDSAVLRDDFGRARKAMRTARGRDYGWRELEDTVTSEELTTATVDLPSGVLDPLLADVERVDCPRWPRQSWPALIRWRASAPGPAGEQSASMQAWVRSAGEWMTNCWNECVIRHNPPG